MFKIAALTLLFAPAALASGCGHFQGCFLRNLSTGDEREISMRDSFEYDGSSKYSVRCDNSIDLKMVNFWYGGSDHVEYGAPYWMKGDFMGNVMEVPFLQSCGLKEFFVTGTSNEDVECFKNQFLLTAKCPPPPVKSCFKCPYGSRPGNGCPQNFHDCVCEGGLVRTPNGCEEPCKHLYWCPHNSKPTNDCPANFADCTCATGFTRTANGCEKPCNNGGYFCPANSMASTACPLSFDQSCVCKAGFVRGNNSCNLPPTPAPPVPAEIDCPEGPGKMFGGKMSGGKMSGTVCPGGKMDGGKMIGRRRRRNL